MRTSALCVCLCVGISGLILILITAIGGWVVLPKIVRNKIADILPLRRDTESWGRWETLPIPIYYRVYVFKVNNPDEIMEGKKPNVTEIGPYVYREKRVKNITHVDEESSTVIYDHTVIFEFDQEASGNLSDNDVITVLNVPASLFVSVLDNLKSIESVLKLFNTAIHKMWPDPNPLFIDVKVKDYLFNGIPIYCNQPVSLENLDTRILCEAFRIVHPKTTKLNDLGNGIHSFSFFKHKNNTSDGIYEIDLGIHDVTKIGQIKSWNKKSTLSHWRGENCNKIVGTDTTLFRPYLEEDNVESLDIYHTDICRSLKLSYDSVTEYKGVTGRRYVIGEDVFAGVLDNKKNYCYCPQSVKGITRYGGCLKSGVLELSSCQGVPVIISHPHFLMTDELHQGKIEGLNPDPEKHRIFMDLEPNTGYPLRAASRIQVNMYLKSIPEVNFLRNLSDVLMPAIWLEETVELTDELIGTINDQLLKILKIADIVKYLLITIGISLTIGSSVYYFVKIR